MKNILLGLLLLVAVTATAQSPFYNDVVRSNTLSPARVANALDAAKAYTMSGTDTYSGSVFTAYAQYTTGDVFKLTFTNANTSGTITVNLNGLGAKAIKNGEGNDLSIGDLKAGATYQFIYNGTHFRMIGAAGDSGGGGATAAGSTGDVQYKSNGGGLQAEAAFNYDSATNTLTIANIAGSVALGGNPTTTTQSAGNNSTRIATTAYADAKVAEAITNGVTGIAPSEDQVFDAFALKAPLASPTFTGTVTIPALKVTTGAGSGKILASDADGDLSFTDFGVISGTSIAGTYTPTLTNSANISASTSHIFNYSRVGNTVTISGYVTIDPTTTATLTTMGISLPPNALSNFSDVQEAGGTAAAIGVADAAAGIMADATNDRLTLQYVCTDVTNHSMFLTATYQVR